MIREVNEPCRTAQTGDQVFQPYRALPELASAVDSRLKPIPIVNGSTSPDGGVEPLATGVRFTPFEDVGWAARFTLDVDDGEGGTATGRP